MTIGAIYDNVERIAAPTAAPGGQPAARRWPLHAARLGWIVLACALSVKAVLVPVNHSVYPCFEAGGWAWWTGQDVYPLACTNEFRYGPVCAVALVPLAWLPTACGGLLWIWLNLAVFLAALQALRKRILPGPWTPEREGVFLGLVLLGVTRSIWSGQSNLLIFALVALGVVALADQRWWLAALMLAIPVHIKVWPLAAALLLIACWPRRLAVRFGLCLLGVGAIPFLAGPFDWVCRQYHGWFAVLLGPAQLRHEYRDAWTIWEVLHAPITSHHHVAPDHPSIYLVLQLATAAVVLGLCLWHARRSQPAARPLLFVLTTWTCWQMVFGPGMERNAFGMIAPLGAWGMLACFEQKRGRVVLCLAFLLMVEATFGVLESAVEHVFPLVRAAHPIGVFLLAGWFLWWNRSFGRSKPVDSGHTLPGGLERPAVLRARVAVVESGDDPWPAMRDPAREPAGQNAAGAE